MKLERFSEDPKRAWIYLEEYVNPGSPSGFTSKYSPPRKYSPGCKDDIAIPIVSLPATKMINAGEWPKDLGGVEWEPNYFPLHPLVLTSNSRDANLEGAKRRIINKIFSRPTASGRTVSLLPSQDWHLKLHYPGILGRVDRALPFRKAIAGLENSLEITNRFSIENYPHVGILPEVAVRSYLLSDDISSISAIVRSTSPKPSMQNEIGLIPSFSLFGVDQLNSKEPILLQQILERVDDPKSEIFRIVELSIKAYKTLAFDIGVVPELNAQNLLYSIGKDLRIKRAIVRDLSRAEKALHIKRANGLSVEFVSGDYKVYDFDKNPDYAIKRHSFSFDFKLCQYVIEPIIDAATSLLRMEKGIWDHELSALIRDWCQLDQFGELFPPAGYYYAHEKILLTGPRPYILQSGNRLR